MKDGVAEVVGSEIAAARATVPLFQARGLRNVKTHYKSYKVVEWMFSVLSTVSAALAGRIPAEAYNMFMCLVRACRLIFVPDELPVSDVATLKAELESFCGLFYKKASRGDIKNITLCLSTFVALLDIPYNIEACGTVWSYWQIPMERYIGTLPALMSFLSSPHAALMNAVARKYRAELISSHASSFHRELGTDASGRDPCAHPEYSRNSVVFPSKENRQATLMSPRKRPEVMAGHELQSPLKVLERNQQGALLSQIFGKKNFLAVLSSRAVAGSATLASDSSTAQRRRSFVRVRITVRVRTAAGGEREQERPAYGLVDHFLLLRVCGKLGAYAHIRCVKSSSDTQGRYGLPSTFHDMDAFRDYSGCSRYVDVLTIDTIVGTLKREAIHVVLHTRYPYTIGEI